MPDIDVLLQTPARLFYEEIATRRERGRLDDIIHLLRMDPGVDDDCGFTTISASGFQVAASFTMVSSGLSITC